ncbi:TetR/AcrR family transcriptional regulator [Prauserella halophila]|uniref:TetR/AcrR family transcriptional regulator n=1 Tax=Prauserella halophila TaxID=185641 RepID=A0ABP4H7Q4_9PSEU|nr:TetR/AcrR family transcriptional regulator [Prauserella halophila]MCP2237619.1 transcriptional regulator, TetR family [Prauserella halophila]
MSPRTRPAGPLSREGIVSAAITLADRDGLDTVSMRRVAEHLRTGPASLYRHVSNRDELVTAMVEQVVAQREYPDPADLDWRECMHVLARQDWSAMLVHPWMITATATVTPPFGAASLASMEWALTALAQLELPLQEAARVIMTINNYVQGTARVVLGDRQAGSDDDPGRSWQRRLRGVDLSASPRLQRLIAEPLPDGDRHWFEDGLDVILDGVEARQARKPGRESELD